MPTKFIFVTGGVVSSLGKGISVASIGRILKSRGLTVSVLKLDPYLNVDPGTMSPYQHGEVFVTQDGGETDLDLGHYERFIDLELTRASNLTAGEVYLNLISKERRGDFLGGTIQTVPHVTNDIKDHILRLAAESGAEVIVVEVGGTVGDIEGLPFLEAIRQMRNQVGRDNVFYIHLTLLPYITAAQELKTKPTQHSVKELRAIGIQPDAIICRSDHPVPGSICEKISSFCDVPSNAVIPLQTVSNVYQVPLLLEEAGLGDIILSSLGLEGYPRDMADWAAMVERMDRPNEKVPIALVGQVRGIPRLLPVGPRGPPPLRGQPLPERGDKVGARRGHRAPRPRRPLGRRLRHRGARRLRHPAASRAWSRPSTTPASTRCPTWASASAFR